MNKEQKANGQDQANGLIAHLKGKWERFSIGIKLFLSVAVASSLVFLWFQVGPEFAKFMTYLVGGGLLIWQIYVSNRRATAAEETAKAMQKTAALTEKGNIAERYKNAIEHLGHKSASIRLGGIYALHHIAWEVEDYRGRVVQILCAHIRGTTTHEGYKPRESAMMDKQPSIEIESILDLLFDRAQTREIYTELFKNLAGANLQKAFFGYGNLRTVYLDKADLQGAHFQHTKLQKVSLTGANLQGATFWEDDFRGADLTNANLQEADLKKVIIEIDRLLQAKTLYKAKLPDGMEQEIKKQKPELFEEPRE
ncbi:pentapeptide repeat-containing protein [Candidatus Spongiihabitans sp.]|uniref:pentapeptide repeat-containing protein n=1 Tax=Candidatus Spongiihabitans sp. TaxID=3101308 RepID=UPI003C6F0D0F